MSAFFVLTHDVTDEARYRAEYVPAVMPFLAKHQGEVVVADFAATALQGKPARGVVVLKFPSGQAIQEFLNDPGYAPVKALRLSITTNANAVMAPEFSMPRA